MVWVPKYQTRETAEKVTVEAVTERRTEEFGTVVTTVQRTDIWVDEIMPVELLIEGAPLMADTTAPDNPVPVKLR